MSEASTTTQPQPDASVAVASASDGSLKISLSGTLTASTLPKIWQQAIDPIRAQHPKRVIIDASGVTYCDGSGLGLFVELRRAAAEGGGEASVENLKTDLQALFDRASLRDPRAPQLQPPKSPGFIATLGKAVANVFDDLRAMISFLGELLAALLWIARHPTLLRWRDLWLICEKVGANAFAVLSLLGFLIGVILAFQCGVAMERYGAQEAIPIIVSIAVTRELGPLITAVLLAGRSGSAFAAEIGTMTVTEEISALRSMGLNPVSFLVVPRVLAAMLMTPLLAIYCNVMALIGGYTVMTNYGFTIRRYATSVHDSLKMADLVGGVAKTIVFALLVGGVGCLRGLRTGSGPGAVGDSTTRAVVAGIVMVILADGVFGVCYYYLGI